MSDDYEYDDKFKEDLIHHLGHFIEEMKKLNENIEKSTDKIEYLAEMTDEFGTEIYKMRICFNEKV